MAQFNPVETFLQEAEELLAEIEQAALSLGTTERDHEIVNQLFRAFHTIKGSGAMCGLDAVAGFTHHVENLLDRVREGVIPVSPALSGLLLKARDHIKVLLGAEQGGAAASPGSGETLIEAIAAFANSSEPSFEEGGGVEAPPVEARDRVARQAWRIGFVPNPSVLACGGNLIALLKEVRALGACEVTAHTAEVPALDVIQADLCYLSWSIELRSDCDRNAIRDVFIFVEDGSKLEIERIGAAPAEEQLPQTRVAPSCAPAPATAPPAKAAARESTVRVPSDRLDRLVTWPENW